VPPRQIPGYACKFGLFHCALFSGLTNIDLLRSFVHLRYVDLSKNELVDVTALGWLDQLLTVRVDFNLLSGAIVLLRRVYLQVASFANNQLTSCDGAAHPMLDHLCLNSRTADTAKRVLAIVILSVCPSVTTGYRIKPRSDRDWVFTI